MLILFVFLAPQDVSSTVNITWHVGMDATAQCAVPDLDDMTAAVGHTYMLLNNASICMTCVTS